MVTSTEHGKSLDSDLKRSLNPQGNLDFLWRLSLSPSRLSAFPICILTVLAFLTRLWRLGFPHVVVFDELFYSRFVYMYINGIFFFDSNPPFAKQLISAVAYAADYGHQNETYAKIGDAYATDTPLWSLRLVPSVCGSLLIPLSYNIIRQLGYNGKAALLTASCFLLDNALVTASRFVMTDSVNLCLVLLALFCILKFISCAPLSGKSILWGLLSGLTVGLAVSTKYVSFPCAMLYGWIVARHFWKTIDDLTIGAMKLLRYFGLCITVVSLIPLGIYVGCFVVHLAVLKKAGPYDTMMSSRFQASLEGGLAAISRGQPYNIVYGSQITLRNGAGFKENPCWLHSHKEVYPIRYSDGRGSSHQQQVTCYAFKDVNNWWIVKHANKTILEVDSPPEYVKDGDKIQLVHGITGRMLNSHDVAAPVSPESQEVSTYIDYNISMRAEDVWEIKIIGQDPDDQLWHTIQTQVQLVHVGSSGALSISGQQLPEWAFNQFEVVANVLHSKYTLSLWNVEEHRYSQAHSGDKEREAALTKEEFLPDRAITLTFWKKFWELQWSMLGLSRDTVEEHVYGSGPLDWIMNDNGVAFWAQRGTNRQIYQLGNPVIWHTGATVLLLASVSLALSVLWRLRYPDVFCLDAQQWNRILASSEVIIGGFALNWMPYLFTDRTLFFHHYYPALAFKMMLLGCVTGEILEYFSMRKIARNSINGILVGWILSALYAFYRFMPLSYGSSNLSSKELHDLEWRESWNFIIRKTE